MSRTHRCATLAFHAGLIATIATQLVVFAGGAQACGEGQFNMGKGMRYQGYLAPRPATVLVYDETPEERLAIYQGLYRAGHRLTVARSSDELSRSLQGKHFDVVISAVDRAAAMPTDTRVLPVVQRGQRNEPGIRARFPVFLLDGASLGQYLKGIDQLVRVALK